MKLQFYKYQGTGNDFIVIDNRKNHFDKNNAKLINYLCTRHTGIGSDGLILLESHKTLDFKMIYFNADGQLSSMCGNGGRCIVHFAKYLNLISDATTFEAIDGIHNATIEGQIVRLKMSDVIKVEKHSKAVFLDTGSPHYVQFTSQLKEIDMVAEGSKIRYSPTYGEGGTNVNFVEKISDITFNVRTYERGVENETLSCGTGVTASAIAMHFLGETTHNKLLINTLGGCLSVEFKKNNNAYNNIWLAGPATHVYKGVINT